MEWAIHHLQCLDRCTDAIWTASDFAPVVDFDNCRMISDMPLCPECGALARPAILMFGDWDWADWRMRLQLARLSDWQRKVERTVVIEIGAGSAIATVRHFSNTQAAPLIRINPTEWQVFRQGCVGIPTNALEGIRGIWNALS